MNISLYINSQKVDTKDDGLILFNYATTDVTDPGVVMNTYTQSVTLPGTPANDAIFGHFFRLDRITADGAFNALKRVPFALFNDIGENIESGYIRLNSVKTDNNGGREYEVTLYGGLGAFLYGQTYDSEGNKKTLASLQFPNLGSTITINRNNISAAWDALINEEAEDTAWGTINFAPAYNGYPGDFFDSKKAYYKPGSTAQSKLYNITTTTSDGYAPKNGTSGGILFEMENKHTEWEMQEFRSYLQRPVLNLLSFLQGLADDAQRADGYHFQIDSYLLSAVYLKQAWMTLALPKYEYFDRSDIIPSSLLFDGTSSPAEYLLGIVKMFGLYLHFNQQTNTITLMHRAGYYDNEVIDLSMRMERAREITPQVMECRRYTWSLPMVGAYAAEYADKYGSEYGSQAVDTGFEFDSETKSVLDGVVFKGSPDVLESSALFQSFAGQVNDRGTPLNYNFKPIFFESVKWRLYKEFVGEGTKEMVMESSSPGYSGGMTYSGTADKYTDFFPKVQLHGEDNKSEDGMNVLVFYNGSVQTPAIVQGGLVFEECVFRITDDTSEMLSLCAGKPCWDATPGNGVVVSSIPSFRRVMSTGESDFSLEFGTPREVATEDTFPTNCSIYDYCWKAFITDRYDKDAKVVRAKVDLRGLRCDTELLRHFFYFDGCIWSLNKIINHSVTTDDLTECEFVKVTNTISYRNQTMF